MFVITDAAEWAQENVGECELGEQRRGARLVRMAGDLARHAGSSWLKSCDGDEAAAEAVMVKLVVARMLALRPPV